MTVIQQETGSYLVQPYLGDAYSQGDVLGSVGMQVKITIEGSSRTLGQQALLSFNPQYPKGAQALLNLDKTRPMGMQALISLTLDPVALGQQSSLSFPNSVRTSGMQYRRHNWAHLDCGGYLEAPYMADPYLTEVTCVHGGFQAQVVLTKDRALGMQALVNIRDFPKAYGEQAKIVIKDVLRTLGMQADLINLVSYGMQANIALYNTTNLRLMCDFPSRGLSTATGTNTWGYPAGKGQTWLANSTETGDFSPFNLNSDIVEKTWRSNGVTSGLTLDCDTERTQGVFLDTLAILNHNMTSSASLSLIGSNVSNFSVIGISIPLQVRADDPNVYYIAPELPNAGFIYWRLAIDDGSNPDGYVEVGTVIFGASLIFTGECFVDEVEFQLKDYADLVNTEAFTNVSNSRAQKKLLRLDFRSLVYHKANFKLMRSVFRTAKTVLKCLWIPTPDPSNQEFTARFALFAKLTQVPSERHNHKGGNADYVNFSIELDESK